MENNTTIVTPCSNSECPYCKGTGIIKVDCTTTGHEAYYQCYSNGSMTEMPGAAAYATRLHQVEQENAELRRQNDKMKQQAEGWRPLQPSLTMQQEKKLREQAEQFFEDAIRQLDDPERKEEVEGERETYIGVWMRGYRAGEAAPSAGREEDISEQDRKDGKELSAHYAHIEACEKKEAVAFSNWTLSSGCDTYTCTDEDQWTNIYTQENITTAELYDIFKQQKEK